MTKAGNLQFLALTLLITYMATTAFSHRWYAQSEIIETQHGQWTFNIVKIIEAIPLNITVLQL